MQENNINACNEVSRAKYTYWHTIVDLGKTSGMLEEDWCRINCISFKTYRHYDGIFRRQEERKPSYIERKQESRGGKEEKENQAGQIGQDEQEDALASDKDSEVSGQSNTGTQGADEAHAREPGENSRYFEIPMETVKAGQDVFRPMDDGVADYSTEPAGEEEHIFKGHEAEEAKGGQEQKRSKRNTGYAAQRKIKDVKGEENVSHNGRRSLDAKSDNDEAAFENAADAITIEAGGMKLSFESGVDEETLKAVLRAVKSHA